MERVHPESTASFCTLSTSDWEERVRWVRDELLPHALETEHIEGGMRWVFPGTERIGNTLEHFVALEAECCSGPVRFELARESGLWVLLLCGARFGPEGFERVAAMPSDPESGPAPGRRVLKAGGAGVALSLGLFCGVPLAAMALFGAGLAAPLAGVDHPLVIALGALVIGSAFWWRGRRANARQMSSGAM